MSARTIPITAKAVMPQDIVAAARGWIGTPYHHQASLKGVGCDCLGLVRGVWRELVGPEPEAMPPYAPDWAEANAAETLLAAAQRHFVAIPVAEAGPGDVVAFRWRPDLPAKHVGILTGPATLVHAYQSAGAVAEAPLVPGWRRRMVAAFRFPGVSV